MFQPAVARRRPAREMAHLALFLTPEELAAVERLAARSGMSAGELGLRALAYGLTVLEATQRQVERDRPKVNEALRKDRFRHIMKCTADRVRELLQLLDDGRRVRTGLERASGRATELLEAEGRALLRERTREAQSRNLQQ